MSALGELLRTGHLRALDHALGLSLQRLRSDTPEAVALAAALASRAVAQGHSRLPLARVPDLLAELVPEPCAVALPPPDEWRAALRASPWVRGDDAGDDGNAALVFDGEAVALRRYARYEQRLAVALRARIDATVSVAAADRDAPEASRHRLGDDADDAALGARLRALFPGEHAAPQAAAARALLTQRLLLLTGGPGTGKTTTIARALALVAGRGDLAAPPRIALAAPTGKAAARLAEAVRENLARLVESGLLAREAAARVPSQAVTLHRLLGWQRGRVDFRHHAGHPLPADVVIVDEASMIDLPLMCKLVEAVSPSATLVLVGDRDQLPSVETGDVLAALCDATEAEPPAPLPRVALGHAHRQADDVAVGRLATLVRDGHAEAALAGLHNELFAGVHWRAGGDRALAEAALAQALPAYRGIALATDVGEALQRARHFRVLTAVREGAAGSQTLNAQLAAALDPVGRGTRRFRGELLIVTENSYRHGLFNGDIGLVWPDADGELRVWFEAEGGPRAWLPGALPAHEWAFALTVHKSQGSEFERVLLALPERGARPVSRELLYTGLTRCRQAVTLWATEAVLREGIARRTQRWSGLAARLAAPPLP